MKYILGDGSLYSRVSSRIDTVLAEADAYSKSSQEGLNSSSFGRFFVSLVDTFAGLSQTFAHNLMRFTKSIKRSELHEFVDSNRVKLMIVDRIPYSRLVGFNIDIPGNLQGTYKNAIENISTIYLKLNTLNTARLTQTALTNIFKSLSGGDHKATSLINSTASVIGSTIRVSKPAVEECHRNFSGKFVQKTTFDSVFLTKDEWNECRSLLLELEPRLQEARSIQEIVETTESTLKGICTYLTDNPNVVNQHDLNAFGEMVKNVALIMDGYQLAVTRQMSLEHNYVLMTNSIYACVK